VTPTLIAIRERHARATKGPYRVSKYKQTVIMCGQKVDCFEVEAERDACWLAQVLNHHYCSGTPEGDANAQFFAAAWQDIDTLLAFTDRQAARIAELEARLAEQEPLETEGVPV
jgi:hypothetical protein